jgi:alpha-tubulin suppressor-like RCC1 family protein
MFLSNLPASLNINSTSGVVTLNRTSLATDAAIADTYWQNTANWNTVIITYKTASLAVNKPMTFKLGVDTATISLSARAPYENLSISSIKITNFDGNTFSITTIANLTPYNITGPVYVPPGNFGIIYTRATGSVTNTIINSLGYAYAWGHNAGAAVGGILGDGTLINRSSPSSIVGGRRFIQVSNGSTTGSGYGTCYALDNLSYAWAWGDNSNGQCANNGVGALQNSPVSVAGSKQWLQIIGDCNYSGRGIDKFSYAWGWGYNNYGQLGNNLTGTAEQSPVSVVGGRQYLLIRPGTDHTLGLDSNSYAYGWGYNGNGQLGVNVTINKSSPTSVVGGKQWRDLYTSLAFSAGMDSLSYAYCWGANTNGVLGNNIAGSTSSPVSVVGGRQFKSIFGYKYSGSTMYALDANNYAYAWGNPAQGQLGDNNTTTRSSPVSVVGGKQWLTLAPGKDFVMALDNLSYAWGWGYNVSGQLGDGTTVARSSPVSVQGGKQFVSIATNNDSYACLAIDANGYAWAWGSNQYGRLGDNSLTDRLSPVSVVGGQHI